MKFYVVSKDIRVVIAGPHITSAREAAKEAMLTYFQENVQVAPVIIVSELGFDLNLHPVDADVTFDTEDILVEAGFEFD